MTLPSPLRPAWAHQQLGFALLLSAFGPVALSAADIQFIHISDQHYGITRTWQGVASTSATAVNQKLLAQINALPGVNVPADGGVHASQAVGFVDLIVEGGDVTNRQDNIAYPTAAADWTQFTADFLATGQITVKRDATTPTPLFLLPGNHEVSNAIGYYKYTGGTPATNTASVPPPMPHGPAPMLDLYRRMINPATTLTDYDATMYAASTAGVPTYKINYSKNIGPSAEVHVLFLNMWPDSGVRAWADADLASVPLTTPVLIFTHDQPDIEAKHLANPNVGDAYPINNDRKFENMVSDACSSGALTTTGAVSTNEQRAFVTWLKTHPNIVGYFHGNSNVTQYYDYFGPDGDITLKAYRVDSPMKGDSLAVAAPAPSTLASQGIVGGNGTSGSSSDDTKVAFNLGSINTATMTLTVREVLWNTKDAGLLYNNTAPQFGVKSSDVPLRVASPVFSVTAGTYTTAQSVSLSCDTPGTTIRYTTDGSTPTLASPVYTAPLPVAATTTIKALAVKNTFASLAPASASATYTITAGGTGGTGGIGGTGTGDSKSSGCGAGSTAIFGLFGLFALLGLWRRQGR